MCRKNHLWGGLLTAFGVGLLIGIWLEGGFFCHIFSLAMIIAGGLICKSR